MRQLRCGLTVPGRSKRAVQLATVAAQLSAILITAPALAQSGPNPPKIQNALEAVAKGMTRKEYGPVVRTGATVGSRLVVINFEPAAGIETEFALNAMKKINWDRGICSENNVLAFLERDGVSFRITLTPSGLAPVVVSEVTSTSCAREAATGSPVSRIIGGISFAPKPTAEQAMVIIQAYIQANLKDPDSAIVKCGEVTEAAWIKPLLEKRRYGYFIKCEINGKNSYGGYVGYQTYVFRLNGDEFEHVDMYIDKSGLMDELK